MMEKIMANRLDRGFAAYQEEFEQKALEVLRSGRYILGKEGKSFEDEFAKFIGCHDCVGVASGLDALWITFRALGIGRGDEVIVQGNTYIASVMGITINGATPVFVEPDCYYNMDAAGIEEKITEKTKAILVVHLYGQASNMEPIVKIARKHHLKLVEDCAQSHGACFQEKMTGTFGDAGCFSFYPSKNLGAFGDAGAIVTSHKEYAEFAKIYRNYGSEKRYYNQMVGANSRLDELQAGLLRIRLSHIREIMQERTELAQAYTEGIQNPCIIKPQERPDTRSVWHQYVIRVKDRKRFMEYLDHNGVQCLIHYPVPPHLSQAYQYLELGPGSLPVTEQYADEVLSIPFYNGMTGSEQQFVIQTINRYHPDKTPEHI